MFLVCGVTRIWKLKKRTENSTPQCGICPLFRPNLKSPFIVQIRQTLAIFAHFMLFEEVENKIRPKSWLIESKNVARKSPILTRLGHNWGQFIHCAHRIEAFWRAHDLFWPFFRPFEAEKNRLIRCLRRALKGVQRMELFEFSVF